MPLEITHCTNCQSGCFINKYCSEQWKNKISEHKRTGIYREKETIFRENHIVFGVYFIRKGSVKVFKDCTQKKKYIIRLASLGEMIGLRGFAEKNYQVSCSALEDTMLCFIEKNFFYTSIKENPELALALIHFYSEQLSNTEQRLKHLLYFNTRERVSEALLLLNKYFGKATGQGFMLNGNFSRHDIAELSGASTEEVNRTLSVLKREKIISQINGKKILLLNIDKLNENVLANCCENG